MDYLRSNIDLLYTLGICLIVIYIISRFATYEYVMRNLSRIIEEIATEQICKDFKKRKRKIKNRNGNYNARTNKAIQEQVNQLNAAYQFYSKDFYYYYRSHTPILKCKIKPMIKKYMKDCAMIRVQYNYRSMSPTQFFNLRKTIQGDIVGVYVIHNKDRNMYYVGQATRLFFRVNQHFTGHGNGDVYGDYKRGKDRFSIKLIPLVNSGYYDLDKLERDLIAKYKSFEKGYNRTHGNG